MTTTIVAEKIVASVLGKQIKLANSDGIKTAPSAWDAFTDAAKVTGRETLAAGRTIGDTIGSAAKNVANAVSGAGSATYNAAGGVAGPVADKGGSILRSLLFPAKALAYGANAAGDYARQQTAPRTTLQLNETGQADAKAYNSANLLKYILGAAGAGLGVGGLAALSKQTQDVKDTDVYFDSPLTVGDTLEKLKRRRRPEGLFRKESEEKQANFLDVSIHPFDKVAPPKATDAPSTGKPNWGDFVFPAGVAASIPVFLAAKQLMDKKQRGVRKAERQSELDAAQEQFDTARALQYENVMRRKSAELAEQTKQASGSMVETVLSPLKRTYDDIYGGVTNAMTGRTGQPNSAGFKDYMAGAVLLALGSHFAGRQLGANWTSTKSKDDIRNRILRERRAQLAASPYSALPMTAVDIPYKTDVVDADSVLPKL